MLTVYDDRDFLEAALASGATGYVVKSRMASDLSVAINDALAGREFIPGAQRRNVSGPERISLHGGRTLAAAKSGGTAGV